MKLRRRTAPAPRSTTVEHTPSAEADLLRLERERLRAAERAGRVGVFDWDLNTGQLFSTGELDQLFGLPPEGLGGRYENWARLVHPDDLPRIEREYAAWLQSGKREHHWEYRLLRPDGQLRWFESRAEAVRDSAGQPHRVIGTVVDITQRKQTEQALEDMRLILTEAEAIGHLGSWKWLAETGETIWSEEEFRIYGLQPDSRSPSYQDLLTKYFHPEDAATLDQTFRDAVRTGSIFENDHRIVRPDGSVRFLRNRAHPHFDPEGKLVAYVGATLDLTDLKQVEQALHRKNEHLRLLSAAAAELLSGKSPAQTARDLFGHLAQHLELDVYFNFQVDESGSALQLDSCAGIPEEAVRAIGPLPFGQAICGTVAQQRRPIVLCDLPASTDPKTRLLRAMGLLCYACFPLLAGERLLGTLSFGSRRRSQFDPEEIELLQTVAWYVAVAQEHASRRRWLEQTVDQRTTELRETVAELEHISFSMIHDMRAPLRAVHGFADLIQRAEGQRLSPDSQDMLARMANSITHMDLLITDVLNYNKAIRNRLPIAPVQVDRLLRQLLETTPEFRPPHAEVLPQGNFPPVLANEAGLTQCLAELLRNAVKFVPPGRRPRVRIWAEQTDAPQPEHGTGDTHHAPSPLGPEAAHASRTTHQDPATTPSGHQPSTFNHQLVRVWVEDNGPGIPQEGLARIFDLFQRMHGPDFPGTGIGLALVRKLTQRMGGQVGVESHPGQGCRFWLQFPEAQPPS